MVGAEVDPGQVIVDVDKTMKPNKVGGTRRGNLGEGPTPEDLIAPETSTPESESIDKVAEAAAQKWAKEVADAQIAEELRDAGIDIASKTTPTDTESLEKLGLEEVDDAVEKKDMDPGVGGGVDRDKLPESDFAGPHRSYPIVNPSDVGGADETNRSCGQSRCRQVSYYCNCTPQGTSFRRCSSSFMDIRFQEGSHHLSPKALSRYLLLRVFMGFSCRCLSCSR